MPTPILAECAQVLVPEGIMSLMEISAMRRDLRALPSRARAAAVRCLRREARWYAEAATPPPTPPPLPPSPPRPVDHEVRASMEIQDGPNLMINTAGAGTAGADVGTAGVGAGMAGADVGMAGVGAVGSAAGAGGVGAGGVGSAAGVGAAGRLGERIRAKQDRTRGLIAEIDAELGIRASGPEPDADALRPARARFAAGVHARVGAEVRLFLRATPYAYRLRDALPGLSGAAP
jgi:hypothetical protein